MNAFRKPFLLIALFCSMFLAGCSSCEDDEDVETLVAQISKDWKIQSLTVGGNEVADTDQFRLSLNQSGDEPTTFTITTGGVAYNFAGANSGSWSLLPNNESPTQAVFAGNTVSFSASATQLTISYTVDPAVDKNEPAVRFVLVPVE
ncbi:hypothetical protein [Bernardetia sp.]|uniref:hypothetical protein n=1 Tax=Bernardetia sp. TaxID=1937974 RepID=UPI0025C10080|nr:hypothetical protein [Bernardetia sp.]